MQNLFLKQGIDANLAFKFLDTAYKAVLEGVSGSKREFERDAEQYSYRCGKSVWRTSHIKKRFKELYSEIPLRNSLLHLRSYGSDYYLLDGKALICFKQMTARSRVMGVSSGRFKAAMMDGNVKYSTAMLQTLSEMGILKPLPIFYIGFVLDYKGALVDVRMTHYKDDKVDFLMSLKSLTEDNLFSLHNRSEAEVKPKKEFLERKRKRRRGNGGENTPNI